MSDKKSKLGSGGRFKELTKEEQTRWLNGHLLARKPPLLLELIALQAHG